jgi:Protein of unknown function (DUF3632)
MAASGIRYALEEENPREIANCNVSVASEWIIQIGLHFFRAIQEIESRGEDEDTTIYQGKMFPVGPLYHGKIGLCRERWEFWKLRFSEIQGQVDEEVSKMVQRAVDEMERVEHCTDRAV